MKAWISKYALSGGIKEIEAEDVGGGILRTLHGYQYYHGEGREWHRSFADAARRAEEMRIAKIASLKKQIAKLEKLTFVEKATHHD